MVLLAITADTWIVTGLGFGIVLLLLFFLVYVLRLFGFIMQKATAPREPKPEKPAEGKKTHSVKVSASNPSEDEKAAIAMAIAQAGDEDIAAIAYALFLAQNKKHDIPTAMISLHKHETAWNEKSVGMNNVGF
ncbi:MAG: OadG family protein [Paludibacteraceae bacterium]|nr:OadG family protein [Paludibacteraceae bacterium]